MITGFVQGQVLRLSAPVVAADTLDYLTAQFVFRSADWSGMEKWAHFAKGGTVYDIPLTEDKIRCEDHLNLGAGEWKVYIHGNRFADGTVVERITTAEDVLRVVPTGALNGEPFPEMPASVTEQILARLDDVEQNGGGSGGGVQVDETLSKAGYAADAAAVGEKLKKQSNAIADLGGINKPYAYTGERITLKRYAFDYAELFNTVADGVGMQDGCAYGDYYFQFTPNGRFGVYDLRDNSFVGAFDLDKKDTIVPHCNSASLSGVFYQPEDLFPLVYINAYNNTNLPCGTCYVHRILKDGNTFSTQLVQILRIGFTDSDMWLSTANETRPYGNFVVDTKNKHLYAYTTRDADKVTRFFQFDLPNVGLIGQSAFSALDYDASKATDNTTFNATTGQPGTSTTYWATDYIGIGIAVGVNINVQAYRVFCYDSSKSFIGYRDAENKYNDVDLFDGSAYIRVLFHKSYTTFEQSADVIIRGLLHIESSLGYDPNNAVDEKALSGALWQDNANYWITGYISTYGHTSCWFNFRPYKVTYLDAQYAVVGSEYPTGNTVNIPQGAAYVIAQYTRTKNTPFETARSLVVLEAEPIGEEEIEIVLNESDVVEHFDTDYFAIPQGCECHNERLYVTSGWGDTSTGSYLHVIDPKTKREVSTVDFMGIINGEPEAVAVIKDRFLYGAGGTMYELRF